MFTVIFVLVMVLYVSLVYGMVGFLVNMLVAPAEFKSWLEDNVQEKKNKQMPALRAASNTQPVGFRPTEYEIDNM